MIWFKKQWLPGLETCLTFSINTYFIILVHKAFTLIVQKIRPLKELNRVIDYFWLKHVHVCWLIEGQAPGWSSCRLAEALRDSNSMLQRLGTVSAMGISGLGMRFSTSYQKASTSLQHKLSTAEAHSLSLGLCLSCSPAFLNLPLFLSPSCRARLVQAGNYAWIYVSINTPAGIRYLKHWEGYFQPILIL